MGRPAYAVARETEGEQSAVFEEALHYVMEALAKMIAADGEGAGRLMTCTVTHAADAQSRGDAGDVHLFFFAGQGGDVWRGCQLGPGALRDGVFRR